MALFVLVVAGGFFFGLGGFVSLYTGGLLIVDLL